jgi:hypothetical protein
MKIEHFIAKTIMEYPTLYKSEDYEQSKLKVLDDIFFVIGNGLKFADTGDEKTGGYIIEPDYKKKRNGDYVRLLDKPYGVVTHPPLPENYFETKIYETHIYEGREITREQCANYDFSPYPFGRDCSKACIVYDEDIKLQPDWMAELVYLCKVTLDFFSSDEKVKVYTYYPLTKDKKEMEGFIKHREKQMRFLTSFLEKYDK